jgi:hypothetical protein
MTMVVQCKLGDGVLEKQQRMMRMMSSNSDRTGEGRGDGLAAAAAAVSVENVDNTALYRSNLLN